MPSCLSTGVKLGRQPCLCASRGVVAEETRNSVKEEPRASSGGGGAGHEQRRLRIARRASRWRNRGRAKWGPRSRVGGSDDECVGAMGKQIEPAAAKRGQTEGARRKPQRRWRHQTTNSRGRARPGVSSARVAKEG
ncbi:hypothetical protein Scep_022321 [Stephania cephalantha]|uniref:Uncharacterized protein n=1 Tax=Stephania cephalantha TaxID=152367 RepID=A0AAP0I0V9_9MAGN